MRLRPNKLDTPVRSSGHSWICVSKSRIRVRTHSAGGEALALCSAAQPAPDPCLRVLAARLGRDDHQWTTVTLLCGIRDSHSVHGSRGIREPAALERVLVLLCACHNKLLNVGIEHRDLDDHAPA